MCSEWTEICHQKKNEKNAIMSGPEDIFLCVKQEFFRKS